MGKTNQIDNLAQQRQDFQNYLNQLVGLGVNLPTTYHCLKALP